MNGIGGEFVLKLSEAYQKVCWKQTVQKKSKEKDEKDRRI